MAPRFEILVHQEDNGRRPFDDWLSTQDRYTQERIEGRIRRLAQGNLGDWKPLGEGLAELRLHFGPGYRVYFGIKYLTLIVLLCAGDKSTQKSDIEKARNYWRNCEE